MSGSASTSADCRSRDNFVVVIINPNVLRNVLACESYPRVEWESAQYCNMVVHKARVGSARGGAPPPPSALLPVPDCMALRVPPPPPPGGRGSIRGQSRYFDTAVGEPRENNNYSILLWVFFWQIFTIFSVILLKLLYIYYFFSNFVKIALIGNRAGEGKEDRPQRGGRFIIGAAISN